MKKRSVWGSILKVGWHWIVALLLVATAGLGSSIIERIPGLQPLHGAPMHATAAQAQPKEGTSYPVPAASEVFSGTPLPETIEAIPSF